MMNVFERADENPLITPGDVKPSRESHRVVGAFNAGVTKMGDEYILLLRVAEQPADSEPGWSVAPIWDPDAMDVVNFRAKHGDPALDSEDERVFRYGGNFYLTSLSHLRVARSTDGVRFTVDEKPAMFPRTHLETFGLEDPRITRIGEDFWITYKAVSQYGITTALAHTRDFENFERHGVVFCPENLDVVIFPEQFDGEYVAWTRPVGKHLGPPAIWIARSKDLIDWGRHEPVLSPRPGMWDGGRVGSSCVPFRTDKGWVEVYHGADPTHRYCVGIALIDEKDPAKLIARSDEPLMQPEAPYEEQGFFGRVVFATGCVVEDDGEIKMYYGAADEHTCMARTSVAKLLGSLKL